MWEKHNVALIMNRHLFSNKIHTPQQEAEASAPRAEPQAEKRASLMGAGASVSDYDEVELSS